MQSRTLFSPSDLSYEIKMKVGQSEVLLADSPKQFLQEIYRQIAIQIAGKVVERLGPAIDKALEDMRLQEPERS